MSHTVPEVANYDQIITVPDDGDPAGVSSVNGPFGSLANRTKFLGLPSQFNNQKYPLASRTLVRTLGPAYSSTTDPNQWTMVVPGFSGGPTVWVASTASPGSLFVPLHAPNGSFVSQIQINIQGAPTDVALPAIMPVIQVFTTAPGFGVSLNVAVTDTTALLATYIAASTHVITVSGSPIFSPDNAANTYFLVVKSEGGANAHAGMTYVGGKITFTTSAQDDGAS